jgi:hypothetical protein
MLFLQTTPMTQGLYGDFHGGVSSPLVGSALQWQPWMLREPVSYYEGRLVMG